MLRHRLVPIAFSLPLTALHGSAIHPQFVGGIQEKEATACVKQVQQSQCNLREWFSSYMRCVRQVLKQHDECKQSLLFFKLTHGGVFHRIKDYPNVQVILADYVYIADQGTGYYLITKKGQFFSLPFYIKRKVLKASPGYVELAKKHPRLEAWGILDFPTGYPLPNGYRLVFEQELKDGCNACAIAGTATVAYDFSKDGELRSTKVLSLKPNPVH